MKMAVLTEPARELKEQETEKKVILFVCSGNTCRSPMCAAAVNGLSPYREAYFALSAGLAAYPGDKISPEAVRALEDAGIAPSADNDYPAHRATPITDELLAAADLIVPVSGRHQMVLLTKAPLLLPKLKLFPGELADPYGGDDSVYADCLRQILAGLPKLLGEDEANG